ncbi:MAG: deoxyribodipyrimidine photo-lyase, partial [Nitrospirales bacterium]|nr:deoxyribodipyrimidine photo-lyase [Nitrospirales bacterium]
MAQHSHIAIVWFRKDLRLQDNPALQAAIDHGGPIVPLFIWDSNSSEEWAMGSASKWWLHQSLISLDKALTGLGSRLTICCGNYSATLEKIIRQIGATAVFWNRDYEPSFRIKEQQIMKRLEKLNVTVQTLHGSWLFDPDALVNKSGKAYQVFTPFWKHCLTELTPNKPVPSPSRLPDPVNVSNSIPIQSLELEPKIDWASGLRDTWNPGEAGANRQFSYFLKNEIGQYETDRDRPDLRGSSRLSPHLHFGEISPRLIWHDVTDGMNSKKEKSLFRNGQAFLRQLGWREFANHLLHHFPHTATQPLRSKFKRFPWKTNRVHLKAWQKGKTG